MENYNRLTPAETERLAILSEECSEVIHMCSKIIRHGYESSNPNDPNHTTNRDLLAVEIGDTLHAIGLVTGDLDILTIKEAEDSRPERMARYLHHQGD